MTNTKHTPEAEALADAILKAAGSGLRHYTMAKTREAILEAAQEGIDEGRKELLEALELMVRWTEKHGLDKAELITGGMGEVPAVAIARKAIAKTKAADGEDM